MSALGILAVGTLVIAACGKGDDQPADASAGAVTVPVSAVTTTVLDAGTAPVPLRVRPSADAVQQLSLNTSARITQQIDDQPEQDLSTPASTLELRTTTAPSAADGYIASSEITGASSPDETLNGALAATRGAKAELTVQPTGAITALPVTPTPASIASARSATDQAFYQVIYRSVVLPEAPIGVGARWQTRQRFNSMIDLDQTIDATLTRREADVLTIDFTVTQRPVSDAWDMGPGQGSLTIDQYEAVGTGTLVLDLTKPLPTSVHAQVGGNQSYHDPVAGTMLRQFVGYDLDLH